MSISPPVCFEQGSLPSLLALPGDASLMVLPGDGMFQAQRIVNGNCPTKKAYSCSVSGFASHGTIYTSDTPLTAGCLLTKSTFPLVLIVIPHRILFERCLSIPYIDMLLGPQKPARGTALEESQRETIVLPALEEVLVTLRLQVDSCRPSDVSALIQILLGGTPVRCRNRHLWIQAVQDSFVPLGVPCRQRLQYVCESPQPLWLKLFWFKPSWGGSCS